MKRFSRPVCELLSLHEMFRRMGYPPEELFVSFGSGLGTGGASAGTIQFILRRAPHHEKPDFVIDVAGGKSKHPADDRTVAEFGAEWERALLWWNADSTPDALRRRIYRASEALAESVMIAQVLAAKGFIAPTSLN